MLFFFFLLIQWAMRIQMSIYIIAPCMRVHKVIGWMCFHNDRKKSPEGKMVTVFPVPGNHQNISWDDIEAFNQIWKWFSHWALMEKYIHTLTPIYIYIKEKNISTRPLSHRWKIKIYKFFPAHIIRWGTKKIRSWDAFNNRQTREYIYIYISWTRILAELARLVEDIENEIILFDSTERFTHFYGLPFVWPAVQFVQ